MTEIRLGYAGAAKEGVTCMHAGMARELSAYRGLRLNIKLAAARAALLSSARVDLFQPRRGCARWLGSRVLAFASLEVHISMIGCIGGCERLCRATVCGT